jgi:hypothetical protein
MGRIRSLRRALLALFLSLCVLFFFALIVSQIEQHLFRRRAELLLAEIQSLELRKTPWQQAQTQLQRWRANTEVGGQCNEQKCSLKITLDELVLAYASKTNLFVKLDDYLRWRLKLTYDVGPFVRLEFVLLRAYMRIGGRPARVLATIGMRDGVVWSKGLSVFIETYAQEVPEFFGTTPGGYTLIADTHSAPRFDYYDYRWISAQLKLHPDYMVGRPGGCEICVEGWAKFTPYAAPADIHRLMQFDLSCLARWRPCLTQSDIMPAAWAQHEAEQPHVDELRDQLACSQSIIEMLGRDSANMVTGEILGYHERVDGKGYQHVDVRIRVLERLKGAAEWKAGETRDVSDLSGIGGDSTRLRTGTQLIFFGGWGSSKELRIDPGYGCPILLLNETNLSLVRRGIAQDYTANDKAE